tara:strand:- start:1032 stop:1286 length:255 start_codon:yes stop_codon:yes gene_type:complete
MNSADRKTEGRSTLVIQTEIQGTNSTRNDGGRRIMTKNFEPNCEVYFKPNYKELARLAKGVNPRKLTVKIIMEDGTEYTGRVER